MDSACLHSLRRLLKLHADAEDYYRRCAQITTEADLVELFGQLAGHRKRMAGELLPSLPPAHKGFLGLEVVLSFFNRTWYHVKLALIINDREKILGYCARAETGLLQDYRKTSSTCPNLPEELFRRMTAHQQNIQEMVERVKSTPLDKYFMQKRLAEAAGGAPPGGSGAAFSTDAQVGVA